MKVDEAGEFIRNKNCDPEALFGKLDAVTPQAEKIVLAIVDKLNSFNRQDIRNAIALEEGIKKIICQVGLSGEEPTAGDVAFVQDAFRVAGWNNIQLEINQYFDHPNMYDDGWIIRVELLSEVCSQPVLNFGAYNVHQELDNARKLVEEKDCEKAL